MHDFIQSQNIHVYGYKLDEYVHSLKVPEKVALPLSR